MGWKNLRDKETRRNRRRKRYRDGRSGRETLLAHDSKRHEYKHKAIGVHSWVSTTTLEYTNIMGFQHVAESFQTMLRPNVNALLKITYITWHYINDP